MKVGAIIFSRFNSHRLPGKALLDISGRPLLGRVIDRTKDIQGVDKIIIATSTHSLDDQIESFAKKEKIEIYRGSLNNVASRALKACLEFKIDKFVRVCGDRPIFSPNLISQMIEISLNSSFDITTTTFPRTYPPGLTCEILKTQILIDSIEFIKNKEDQEHLTSYFYKNAKDFKIKNIKAPNKINFDGINLCVDTKDDLDRAIWITNEIDKKELSYDNIADIVDLARKWDSIFS